MMIIIISFYWCKPQGIKDSNWASSHGHDVTYYPADARCSPTKWLYSRRMVVALNVNCQDVAVTNVKYACIIARADYYMFALCGQQLQIFFRRLIGTML